MVENVLFQFFVGDTYSRDFTIYNYPEKISQIYFTVKESDKDKRFKIQKKLNSGITLVEEEDGMEKYNILINPQDTDGLKVGRNYTCDVKIVTNANPQLKKTIITGILKLKDHTTKVYNE